MSSQLERHQGIHVDQQNNRTLLNGWRMFSIWAAPPSTFSAMHTLGPGKESFFKPKPRPHAYDSMKRLLKAGADVHLKTRRGKSCLTLATHDVKMVRLLIKHGAIISPDDVVSAVEAGRVDILRKLLHAKDEDGQDPDLNLDPALRAAGMLFRKPDPDDDFWSPSVDNAIVIEMIGILIDHGANPLSNYLIREKDHVSCARPEYIHFKKGESPPQANANDLEGTLLHHLILVIGEFQLQPFLVPGIDVNHRDPKGLTLLHAAYNLGRTVLTSLLWSYSITTPGLRATLDDMIRLAPKLVHDADDSFGDTPLIYAIRRAVESEADTEAVQRLLSAGASPLVANKNGDGVLHKLAEDLGTPRLRHLFRDLVRRGADINERNSEGETPLFKFAKRYPQDPNNRYNRDYFKQKVRGDAYEVPREQGAIALLRELGADFSAKDNEGRGLLHVAATGDVVRFQELMAAGLDPMMENNAQQTAIDVAAACSNNSVLEIFEKKARR
ncbi:ankyrin repeat-containing domain protein [Dactylonectria macrodidyma]|uniref:Ankyrin repeat-containing domain protein n=1 Tax=Dactylonectria macrodidyma TaxID=307937 RepID=A0A9P9ES76_9HYPO|nr:ankyrin repeat-containing domain protein [Dactylonectria macrodidyma]KAH7146033.1 ankyrin repeat-containing domain protein [Dactylonectria macrodidyma]